ncbi:unnamed protein product, partial [marine sediment metagenome]
TRLILANPVLSSIAAIVTAGAIISNYIDEEEGLDNYTGFLTAGIGGNDPNYWSGDVNNSGYFNIGQNLATVMNWYTNASTLEAQEAAEAEYIRNYWGAKKAQEYLDNMDEAEKEAYRQYKETGSFNF